MARKTIGNTKRDDETKTLQQDKGIHNTILICSAMAERIQSACVYAHKIYYTAQIADITSAQV